MSIMLTTAESLARDNRISPAVKTTQDVVTLSPLIVSTSPAVPTRRCADSYS